MVSQNNRNSFTYSSGGQKSQFKVSEESCSLWNFQERILPCFFLASGGTQKSLAVLTFICITFISVSVFSWPSYMSLCSLLFLLSIHPYYYKIAYKKIQFFFFYFFPSLPSSLWLKRYSWIPCLKIVWG